MVCWKYVLCVQMIFLLGNDGIFIFGNYGNWTIVPDYSARLVLRTLAKLFIWNLSVQIEDTGEVSTECIVWVSWLPHNHWVLKRYFELNSVMKELVQVFWEGWWEQTQRPNNFACLFQLYYPTKLILGEFLNL